MGVMNNFKIERKQGSLFLRSIISNDKDYKWLSEVLKSKQYPELLYREIDNLQENQQSFLNDIFPQVYKQACEEWDDDGEEVRENWEEKMTCTLCGKKHNKYIKYIRNMHTKERINLGSTCIDTYNDSSEFSKKDEQKNRKFLYEVKRKNRLNETYSGIVGVIEKWSSYLDGLPIFVSEDLENKYNKIGDNLNKEYKAYLKVGTDEYFPKLKSLCDLLELTKNDIEKYIDDIKCRNFPQTKEIKSWCKMNHKQDVISILKQEGNITLKSAYRIFEPNLMNDILTKYLDIFAKAQIEIKSIESTNVKINFKINIYPYLVVKYDYKTFIDKYGDYAFSKENCNISYTEILKDGLISETISLALATKTFKNKLRYMKYFLKEYNENNNEIIFENKELDVICIVRMSLFISTFKNHIYQQKLDVNTINLIEDFIEKNTLERLSITDYYETKEVIKKSFRREKETEEDEENEKQKV